MKCHIPQDRHSPSIILINIITTFVNMRKQSIPNKVILQSNSKHHSRKSSIQSIKPKKPTKNISRAPSKSPSLQPFNRSNSHDQFSGRLSFNKQISKGRYENSIDNINTKEQTFITNQESSYRSTIQCQSQNTKRKEVSKDNRNILSAQKSFFQSIESRTSKKSIMKASKDKRLKSTSKNVEMNGKSKEKKKKPMSASKREKGENPSHVKSVNENGNKKFEIKKMKFQKRITEVSEEEFECTMGSPKLISNTFFLKEGPESEIQIHVKKALRYEPPDPMRELLVRVKQQVQVILYKEHSQETKVLVAIIFIQKLWRQKYVKKIINSYLKPKQETPRLKGQIDKTPPIFNIPISYQLKLPKPAQIQKRFSPTKPQISTMKSDRLSKYIDEYKVSEIKNPPMKKVRSLGYQCFLPKTLINNKIDRNIDTVRIERIKEAKNRLLVNGRKDIKLCLDSGNAHQQIPIENRVPEKESNQQQTMKLCSQIMSQLVDHFLSYKRLSEVREKKALPTIKLSSKNTQVYLQGLVTYLMESPYKGTIISNLAKPLGIKPLSFLKFMRSNDSEDDQDEQEEQQESEDEDFLNQPVVPTEIFVEYQEHLQSKSQNSDETYKNFRKNIERIHNKALIDAFSELVEEKRLYGLKGKPFPWQNTILQRSEPLDERKLQVKLRECQEEVVRYTSYNFGNRHGIDEMKFLSVLYEQYLKTEYEWKTFDQELFEINLQISSQIIIWLIEQACWDMK